jgi:hypothetical protein
MMTIAFPSERQSTRQSPTVGEVRSARSKLSDVTRSREREQVNGMADSAPFLTVRRCEETHARPVGTGRLSQPEFFPHFVYGDVRPWISQTALHPFAVSVSKGLSMLSTCANASIASMCAGASWSTMSCNCFLLGCVHNSPTSMIAQLRASMRLIRTQHARRASPFSDPDTRQMRGSEPKTH